MTEAKFVVKAGEPFVIKYEDPNAILTLKKATVAGNDKKEVTLKIEFEDFPEDFDPNEKEVKPVVQTKELGKLKDGELSITQVYESSQKPKLIVEGAGEVTVIGEFKGLPDEDEDMDEEEEGEESGSDEDSD